MTRAPPASLEQETKLFQFSEMKFRSIIRDLYGDGCTGDLYVSSHEFYDGNVQVYHSRLKGSLPADRQPSLL